MPAPRVAELVAELKAIPSQDRGHAGQRRGARRARSPPPRPSSEFFLYLGRHIGLPVCLEGALKLKEISYIPTDAYAAGEMKHGPIALLDESTPVICVATESPVLDKVLSNVEEVRARGAETIAIATEGDERAAEVADQTIEVARTRLDPAADRRDPATAAARLRHCPRPRAQRRPAAQPGEDRDCRVERKSRYSFSRHYDQDPSTPFQSSPLVAHRHRRLRRQQRGSSSSGSDPASLAAPGSLVYVEGKLQPTGELKQNVDSVATGLRRRRRPRRIRRLRTRKLGAPAKANRSTSPRKSNRGSANTAGVCLRTPRCRRTLRTADRDREPRTPKRRSPSSTSAPSQGKNPSKDVSYEGVDFKVGGSEDNAVGLVDETVVIAESEKEFKAAVDASNGESLGGEDRFQNTISNASNGSLADIYVDVGGILEQSEDGEIESQAKEVLQATGIDPERSDRGGQRHPRSRTRSWST